MIKEGSVKLNVKVPKKISKEMAVFYNPVMELNRSLSILLLNAIDKKKIRIGLPLAGTGVRGIRFLKELKKGKIEEIHFNDYDKSAVKNIKSNLRLNRVKLCNNHKHKIQVSNKEANDFLLSTCGFDYIDVDPFGTPNPFLDSAVKRISRNGVLAVTATDTSALCGTYPKACNRKYWAKMNKGPSMHEYGIRVLIRKCQLIGSQFDKALIPIFSYSSDHYMRVFFSCIKRKERVDEILKEHKMINELGPMFAGRLWDAKLAGKMLKINIDPKLEKLLKIIVSESTVGSVGYYSLPYIVKINKLGEVPKQERIINKIRKTGYKCTITHFAKNSIRTNLPENDLVKIIKKLTQS